MSPLRHLIFLMFLGFIIVLVIFMTSTSLILRSNITSKPSVDNNIVNAEINVNNMEYFHLDNRAEIHQNIAENRRLQSHRDHEIGPILRTISKPINLLLLAYQRSGSSFLGEMLSVRPDSMYVFEPIIEITNKRNIKKPEMVRDIMKRIYQCDRSALEMITDNRTAKIEILRKLGSPVGPVTQSTSIDWWSGCQNSKVRVIKTIRLRMDQAKLLLEDVTLNLKIIHLVRDPRAILNSMQNDDTWISNSRNATFQCEHIKSDLDVVGVSDFQNNYIRVRYEDLVENPLGMVAKIYEFLMIPLHKSLAFYLTTHTESERFFKKLHQTSEYFSTYRKSDHDHQSWQRTMTSNRIREIEMECLDVMRTLNYLPIN